ncbi:MULTISPECIES: DUF4845 domain-containing protein [Silvimonas]|uniref:DUF4845 domain-containing protein n=1 Tax=Silvimonas TaxID=300264 RepID=UPI0024B334AF|nr:MULTISPECIES: DUF4845 domain-containing protein [Silvimonas]MDR3428333.1 DUF4845 domain-containing protein [Silvimonas sp.]
MRKQSGLSFIGFIIIAMVVGAAAVTFFKVIPAWVEYFNIQKTLATLVKEEAGSTPEQIRASYSKHAQINDTDSVKPQDLVIVQSGGVTTISASYERVVPLMGNASLLFAFDAEKSSASQSGQ